MFLTLSNLQIIENFMLMKALTNTSIKTDNFGKRKLQFHRVCVFQHFDHENDHKTVFGA